MKQFSIFLLVLFVTVIHSQNLNVRKWRQSEKDSMSNGHLLYEEKNYKFALPYFEQIHKHHPKEIYIKYVYGQLCLTRSDKYEEALIMLDDVYKKNRKVKSIEYDLARALHYNYKFDEALEMIDRFLANKRTKKEEKPAAEFFKKFILNAQHYNSIPTKAKVTNIGTPINSPDEEYLPIISADESTMIFTYSGVKSKGGKINEAIMETDIVNGIYMEDIYMSTKVEGKFQAPIALDYINTSSNDAAVSLSQDGQILFIYKEDGDNHGDIYKSTLVGENFSFPEKLKGEINTYSQESNCTLSPDGKTMYFTSNRFGGFGGKDIYRAILKPDSTWGNIVNLGDSVNTKYDEDSPFIHPDGKTLFFSSTNTRGSGGYDIYKAYMEPTDSSFKRVENLGFPINTPDDDLYFVLAANGERGYYSSGRVGGEGLKDIYMVETGFVETKPSLLFVKGKVTLNDTAVESNIVVEMTSKNNSVFNNYKSVSTTGNYLISLPAGQSYKITYNCKTEKPQTQEFDATQITGFVEKIVDIKFNNIKEIVKIDSVKKDTLPILITPPTKTLSAEFDKEANTLVQKKISKYASTYGKIATEGLEFKVQIAAVKVFKPSRYTQLKGLGKIEQTVLPDGITRVTINGSFKTLEAAWEYNKKLIKAGQKDAFVTALYQGKRVLLEELVKMDVFK